MTFKRAVMNHICGIDGCFKGPNSSISFRKIYLSFASRSCKLDIECSMPVSAKAFLLQHSLFRNEKRKDLRIFLSS